MPLKYTDLRNVYPNSTGFYIVSGKKASSRSHAFKIGSGRKLISRLNSGYTLCFMPTGFYLYCVIRLKARYKSSLVSWEHDLFRFLDKKGFKRIRSSVRERKTEWFKCKLVDLEKAVAQWVAKNKQKVIFIKGNYNAIETWNGMKIASPVK